MSAGVVLFTLAALLLIALGVPLLLRRVRPNVLYGLRSRATLGDESVWYDANARLGRNQILLGGGLLVLAWALLLIPGLSEATYCALCVTWLVAGVLVNCKASGPRLR